MTEKNMTLDIINSIKSDISALSKAVCECKNLGLRQSLQQMCANSEQAQYDFYNIASQRGFYSQPAMATQSETASIKNTLSQAVGELRSAMTR